METKLTEEGEVVKATQDIYTLRDDFLENPNSFIKEEEEEVEDEDEEAVAYPSLDDFAYRGEFQSNVFENTPKTSFQGASAKTDTAHSKTASNSRTGDTVAIILIIFSAALLLCAASIGIYLVRKKNHKREK